MYAFPSLFTLSEKIMSLISVMEFENAPDFQRGIVAGLRIAQGMAEMYEQLQAQPIFIRASEPEDIVSSEGKEPVCGSSSTAMNVESAPYAVGGFVKQPFICQENEERRDK